jgi:hypothetical protein
MVYHIHKSLPSVPILIQSNRFPKVSFNIFPYMPALLSGLYPWGFPTKMLYTFLLSPMRATRTTHLILILCGEEYKSWSSLLCSFLLVSSSLVGPDALLAPCSWTRSICSFFNVSRARLRGEPERQLPRTLKHWTKSGILCQSTHVERIFKEYLFEEVPNY